MKVLHVISSVDPRGGGPVEGIFKQVEVRQRLGIETHLATIDPPDANWVPRCPVHTIPLGQPTEKGRKPLGYSPAIVPWLKAHKDDYNIVVVNGLWNYATLAARRALVGTSTPYVVFTHGMLDPWFKTAAPLKSKVKQLSWWVSEGPLLNNARAVLFTSDEELRQAHNAFSPYRINGRVVGYGTADLTGDPARQIAAFHVATPSLDGKPYLLFLSRIHHKKGCDLLIEAFAHVAKEHPDVQVVMAGPDQTGWKAELEEMARERGISDRLHWPGMLSGDVKAGAYRGCEAFVLPSHQENFGIVVAEALAASKPVLITNKVNIWREIEAAGAGIIANDDAASVTTQLKSFLALSASDRAAMGARARDCFMKNYNIENAARSVIEVLREYAT